MGVKALFKKEGITIRYCIFVVQENKDYYVA